jgi:serine/threonine protein kinase
VPEALPNHTSGAHTRDIARVLREQQPDELSPQQAPDALETHTTTLYISDPRVFRIGSNVAGRFEILEFLGAGGMGEVYHARDHKLRRSVAVKTISIAFSRGQVERKRRLLQEARAASALTHPNVATIYDVGEHQGVDYIAMEYVQGPRLDQLIRPTGLPVTDVLGYAEQIARALRAAHAAGVIHRDVKPSNIVVTTSGAVKVLDFGIAKVTDEAQLTSGASAEGETLTRAGAIIGTVGYMSPEQAQGRPIDARSDIFSFGCVLYEMISGQRPFMSTSELSALFAIVHQEPLPLRNLNPRIPVDVEAFILRCLHKDPSRRFPSMATVEAEVHKLKASAAVMALELSPPRRRWITATIMALTAAITLAGLWWTFDDESNRSERTRLDVHSAPNQAQTHDANDPTWLRQLLSTAPESSLVDQVGVVDAESRRYLETYANRMFESSGPQIVFLLIPTLEGRKIEDVAQKVFNTWRIGRQNQNDGLLLMLAVRDRTSRLHVGRGLEFLMPPETCTRILDQIKPALREGQYGLALRQASLMIGSILHGGKMK